jgi:hypothetical protein
VDYEEAELRLENFTGPRGIQNMIAARRKEGIVMPFRVTLTRGCKYGLITAAPAPTEDDMGRPIDPMSSVALAAAVRNEVEVLRWKRHLKYGDMIRIQGAFFKVITGDDLLSAYDESNEVGSEAMSFNGEAEVEAVHSDSRMESKKTEEEGDEESEEEGS